jgi:P-type conjugative transfer protein TrbJ
MKPRRLATIAVSVIVGVLVCSAPHSGAQMTVFDPANFQQNLLTAARELEQINNQVRVLQNQVLMIARMDQNLVRLGGTMSPELQSALGSINTLLRAGDGIALRLAATQSGYEQLFPRQASAALTHDDALRNAKARWDEQYGAFQRAALLQGQIADGIETDTSLLATAMGRSRDAGGALEAVQAGNELTALNVKQTLALQGLLAAQYRAETTKQARDLAAEEDARQRFKTFLGTGTAYTASRY